MTKIALLLLIPLAAHAQLAVFTFDGTTETPVGATYSFGAVAAGNSQSVRFRIFNDGTSPVTVYAPTVNGTGFAITALNGTMPYSIPPATATLNFFEFTVTFTGGMAANYSASLQISGPSISTINILLLAATVPSATLTGFPPGCSPNGSGGITFAAVAIGAQGLCNLVLTNSNGTPVVISTLSVSGDAAFSISQGPALPLTIAPGSATSFSIQLKPQCGQASYSGTLTVNSTAYVLSATATTPALPQPQLNFDAPTFSSMEQHSVSISLPSPAVCAASGNLNLTFTPNANLPDDSTIVFVAGSSRSLPFSVAAGSSQATINNGASAAFNTGSTAGTISFSLSGASVSNAAPNPAFPIAPAVISIDSATASNQVLGQLNLTITGFDNTYSAGKMSFTFFDGNGNQIGSPVTPDFTSNFQTFFAGQQAGSTFRLAVSFPVQGSCVPGATTTTCQAVQIVSKVQATLMNSAGAAQTGSLTFQ